MLGICYYPEHWPETQWQDDADEMQALGLTYVRVAEFSWARIEPQAGQFAFSWLDRAIDTLATAGLKVIMCTPTATPPKWLIEAYPDILPEDVNTGLVRGFGSRRHCDFSSENYRREALRISEVMAKRYGEHPAVVGWQTDNELACHDTTHSASENAVKAFQKWCKQRYVSIDKLNTAWGNVFWSMDYPSFDSIDIPYFAVTETNPSHQLAYRRFSSDQVVSFHDAMVAIIRKHAPNRWVTHNFIPMADTQTDNYALAKGLDFASFDNYPLGRTDLFFADENSIEFSRYMRTGHPDFSSYYFDQTRGLCQAPFWVMEQQPGPVNWAVHNPRPAPNMIALWSWVAFAHGAESVCYFRWRQVPFAQEQMHAGLKRVDNSPSAAYQEVQQVQQELQILDVKAQGKVTASVAIVSTTTNQWVTEIERQGDSYQHQQVEFQYYHALRRLGLTVDFVSPEHDLTPYKLVVVPTMPIVSEAFIEQCQKSQAVILFGPRSGAKTDEFQLAANLAPGPLQTLINIKVLSVETIRQDIQQDLHFNHNLFQSNRWREELAPEGSCEVLATYADHSCALARDGRFLYLGTLTCTDFLVTLFEDLAKQQGIHTWQLPVDVRVVTKGQFIYLFNYQPEEQVVEAFADATFILGNHKLPANGYAIAQCPSE